MKLNIAIASQVVAVWPLITLARPPAAVSIPVFHHGIADLVWQSIAIAFFLVAGPIWMRNWLMRRRRRASEEQRRALKRDDDGGD